MGREAGGRGPAAAHERNARREGPALKAGGARACAERTANILPMVVTLDVSKLSGWLKASAFCRVARWAYEARGRCVPGGERAVGGGDGASGTAGKGS